MYQIEDEKDEALEGHENYATMEEAIQAVYGLLEQQPLCRPPVRLFIRKTENNMIVYSLQVTVRFKRDVMEFNEKGMPIGSHRSEGIVGDDVSGLIELLEKDPEEEGTSPHQHIMELLERISQH